MNSKKKTVNNKHTNDKKPYAPITIIIVIILLFAIFAGNKIIKIVKTNINVSYNDEIKKQLYIESPQDKITALAPPDEDGASKISQVKENKGDTWTIAIYMVGSDLEDLEKNELSDLNNILLYGEAESNLGDTILNRKEAIINYQDELNANGLSFTNNLLIPNKSIQKDDGEEKVDNLFEVYSFPIGSSNISRMLLAKPSEKIKIVIQTGGARSWERESINPNKTQRFEIKNGELVEIDNLPLLNAADKNTFADFVRFVNSEYKSDHMILHFWDHGLGPFGVCYDTIFNKVLSINEIKEALNDTCIASVDNPPFDAFMFDACFMANAEVANSFKGFTKYFIASPEMIPNHGLNYCEFLNNLSNNPSMTTLEFCKNVVDTFINYYMSMNINLKNVFGTNDEILSVIDVNKASELYDKYSELSKMQLIDSANDISVLTTISKAANKSIIYGKEASYRTNCIDIASYLDSLSNLNYNKNLDGIKMCAKEAVIYKRANGYYKNANGLSIYFPHTIIEAGGLSRFLKYINEVSLDNNINALYYYKCSGCLNEKYNNYTKEISGKTAKILDVDLYKEFKNNSAKLNDGNLEVEIDENLKKSMQDTYMRLYLYDKEKDVYYDYGYRNCVDDKEVGKLKSDFDNKWVTIDGVPLAVEIVNDSDDIIELRSKITKDNDYYLMFSVNRKTNEYEIHGIDNAQSYNSYINNKEPEIIIDNITISPVYTVYDFTNDCSYEETGKTIKLNKNSKIELHDLKRGDYFSSIIIEDVRGDAYESQKVKIK